MLVTEFIEFTNYLLKIVGYPKLKRFFLIKKLLSYCMYKYCMLKCKMIIKRADIKNLLFQFAFLNLYLMEMVDENLTNSTDSFNIKVFGEDSPVTLFVTLKTPGKLISVNTIEIKSKYDDSELSIYVNDRQDLVTVTVSEKDYAQTFSYAKNMVNVNRKEAIDQIELLFRSSIYMYVNSRFYTMYHDLNEAYK